MCILKETQLSIKVFCTLKYTLNYIMLLFLFYGICLLKAIVEDRFCGFIFVLEEYLSPSGCPYVFTQKNPPSLSPHLSLCLRGRPAVRMCNCSTNVTDFSLSHTNRVLLFQFSFKGLSLSKA